MQVNDIQVLHLDYTREPTGYMVGAGGDFQSEGYVWWTGVVLPPDSASDDETAEAHFNPRSASGFKTQAAALAAAWADYKTRNDPPGMEVRGEGGTANALRRRSCRWRIYTLGARLGAYRETRGLGRAEAWTMHDRRHEVASLAAAYGDAELWPRALTWSDEELAQVVGYVRGDKLALSELQRLGVVRG